MTEQKDFEDYKLADLSDEQVMNLMAAALMILKGVPVSEESVTAYIRMTGLLVVTEARSRGIDKFYSDGRKLHRFH